jgi:hypothetical protein
VDSGRPEFVVNPTIVSQVSDCIASGGVDVDPPTIADLEDRVEALEECCAQNTSDIVLLQADVRQLNTRVGRLEDRTDVLEAKVADILTQIAVLPALVEQVQNLVLIVNDILQRCCPKQSEQTCFRYQLLPGDEMIVTANQPVWLNLPTRIEDRSVACGNGGDCPARAAMDGEPLQDGRLRKCCMRWKLVPQGDCAVPTGAVVRGQEGQPVPGGVRQEVPDGGADDRDDRGPVVTLTGEFLLPSQPCCSDVHLLVASSDDKITTAHVVEFADFNGCCVG